MGLSHCEDFDSSLRSSVQRCIDGGRAAHPRTTADRGPTAVCPSLADPIKQEHAEHPEAFDPAAKNGALARAAAEVGTWLFPLLVCVLRAGLRIGEVLALRPEDLDLTTAGHETLRVARARTIDRARTVVLEDPKTEAGRRTLRLSPAVVAVLRRWLDVDRPAWKLKAGWRTLPPWLFFAAVDPATYAADDPAAGLLEPGNVRRAIRRLTEALHAEDVAARLSPEASFPTAWTPHGGRHTVATQLLQAGRPADSVRQLLGHASIRTTADVYGRGGDPEATAGLLEALDVLAPVPLRQER